MTEHCCHNDQYFYNRSRYDVLMCLNYKKCYIILSNLIFYTFHNGKVVSLPSDLALFLSKVQHKMNNHVLQIDYRFFKVMFFQTFCRYRQFLNIV